MKKLISLIGLLLLTPLVQAQTDCRGDGVWLQVLGAGGPEATDQRASSGYLVWRDGKAALLIDMGAGTLYQFERAGARIEDLDGILFTHFHVDHSADLAGLIKASFFTKRTQDLPVYGPTGNARMPGTKQFLQELFGAKGAYRYLNGYLTGEESYRLIPHEVDIDNRQVQSVGKLGSAQIAAVSVHHGPLPAVAWRVDLAGKRIVFSGDMNNDYQTLVKLAADADVLVAHHAIPEQTNQTARNLHMPPSEIGKIAGQAKVKQVVLSHRMTRTLGKEKQTEVIIREHYTGPMVFAEDGQCFKVH